MLVEGNVEGNEGNVAVGLLGFNLLGIYSSSLMINSGRCYLILFVSIVYRQSPRPVVARLLVRLAQSLHAPRPPLPRHPVHRPHPFIPLHMSPPGRRRSLSFREGKGAGCDRWKDGEDHGSQTAAEGPTEAYAEAVWDVEWTASAVDSVCLKKADSVR